jgi:hypothetical protein
MKQTAVEWLEKEFIKLESTVGVHGVMHELIEKAKEMERQQMVDFAEFVASYPDKNRNIVGQMLHAKSKYDGAERTIDLLENWLKQNKKA